MGSELTRHLRAGQGAGPGRPRPAGPRVRHPARPGRSRWPGRPLGPRRGPRDGPRLDHRRGWTRCCGEGFRTTDSVDSRPSTRRRGARPSGSGGAGAGDGGARAPRSTACSARSPRPNGDTSPTCCAGCCSSPNSHRARRRPTERGRKSPNGPRTADARVTGMTAHVWPEPWPTTDGDGSLPRSCWARPALPRSPSAAYLPAPVVLTGVRRLSDTGLVTARTARSPATRRRCRPPRATAARPTTPSPASTRCCGPSCARGVRWVFRRSGVDGGSCSRTSPSSRSSRAPAIRNGRVDDALKPWCAQEGRITRRCAGI